MGKLIRMVPKGVAHEAPFKDTLRRDTNTERQIIREVPLSISITEYKTSADLAQTLIPRGFRLARAAEIALLYSKSVRFRRELLQRAVWAEEMGMESVDGSPYRMIGSRGELLMFPHRENSVVSSSKVAFVRAGNGRISMIGTYEGVLIVDATWKGMASMALARL